MPPYPPYNPYFQTMRVKPYAFDPYKMEQPQLQMPNLSNVGFNARPDYTTGFGYEASRLNNIDASQGSSVSDAASAFSPAAAIGGVVGLATDLSGIANQRLNLGDPTAVYQQGVDPTYQTGEYFNKAFSSVPQKTTGMEVGGTALKTALAAGQATGFNPIAMGVGALVGGVGAAIAGNRRRVKQSRERRTALNKAISDQQRFNTAQTQYNQEQMAMQDYQRRSNPYTRMNNLYSI